MYHVYALSTGKLSECKKYWVYENIDVYMQVIKWAIVSSSSCDCDCSDCPDYPTNFYFYDNHENARQDYIAIASSKYKCNIIPIFPRKDIAPKGRDGTNDYVYIYVKNKDKYRPDESEIYGPYDASDPNIQLDIDELSRDNFRCEIIKNKDIFFL